MVKKDVTEISLEDMLLAQRKKGREEVVEWGETICMEHGMRKRRKCDKCWQAKLKSWGISSD